MSKTEKIQTLKTRPFWRAGIPKVGALLLLAVLLAASSCRPLSAPRELSLILISMNNIGAEHMSLYGYGRPTTPRLDRLAAEGMVFEDLYVPVSWTLPGAVTTLTSLQPYTHGIMDRWVGNVLHPSVPTLGQLLKSQGYTTAAFTGGLDFRQEFGLLRGFDEVSQNPDFTRFETTLKQAKTWLARRGPEKFALLLQGYNAHPPCKPLDSVKGTFSGGKRDLDINTSFALRGYKNGNKYVAYYLFQEEDPKVRRFLEISYPLNKRKVHLSQADIDYLRDVYDDCVLSVDELVGRFVEEMDPALRDRTLIVLYSEHGEMFGKHGRFGRAGTVRGTLYDEVVHVPLVILGPGVKAGRVAGLGQLVDVAPTILELLRIQAPQTFQGQSLMPLTRGETVNEFVYAGASYNLGLRGSTHPFFQQGSICQSIRSKQWKLITEAMYNPGAEDVFSPTGSRPVGFGKELYDEEHDPEESRMLQHQEREVVAELSGRLGVWVQQTLEAGRSILPTTLELPKDVHKEAQKHGYW